MKNKSILFLAATLFISVFISVNLYAEEEPTILERVRKVENPELAELIKIAIINLPESKLTSGSSQQEHSQLQYEIKVAKSKTIRVVTEKYAQIKLLDEKIKQIEKKQISSKNEDIKAELLIVKASLETERLSNIAELREALHLVPWTPLGPKEIDELSTWIHLEILDGETVRVINFRKPFSENIYINSGNGSFLKTPKETIKYIESILKRDDILPIRITFAATENNDTHANDLKNNCKSFVHKNKVEYKTDLSQDIAIIKHREHVFYFVGKDIIRERSNTVLYSVRNFVQNMKMKLQNEPLTLPKTFTIKLTNIAYEGISKTLERDLKEMVKDLKLTDYVTIKMTGNLIKSKPAD